MEYDENIRNIIEQNEKLSKRIDFLEFRVELLAENSNVSSLLFECKITKDQYNQIMDLMDSLRKKLDNKQEVSNIDYENEVSKITGNQDYHFAELLAMAFMEDGRWEEVFPALYGELPKYKHYLESRNN